MKVSVSIELIWQMACREAIAAQFKEVEPEHFLMAMLQLAETSTSDLEQLGAGTEAIGALVKDASALRQELVNRNITCGALRRELRTILGRGNTPYEGGQMHRTAAAREYFEKAATMAGEAGSDTLMGRHLLQTLLENPTPAMAQVLAAAGAGLGPAAAQQPLVYLYEHGKDLNRLVAEQKLPQDKERLAEAKALLRVLGQAQRNNVFLVSNDLEAVRKTVFTAVRSLGGENVPTALKKKRILDVSEASVGATKAKNAGTVEKVLNEAAAVSGIVLFLPGISSRTPKMPAWTETLKSLAGLGKVQFVARLSPDMQKLVDKDLDWKRVAQLIYLAEEKMSDIPPEL